MRFAWTDANGVPQKPNWDELKDLRVRQTLASVEKAGPAMSQADKESHVLNAAGEITGFIDYLGGMGYRPFEDETPACDGYEPLQIEGISLDDLNKDAAFLSLHPRQRHRIVADAELQMVNSQKKTHREELAATQQLRKMKSQYARSEEVKSFHNTVRTKGRDEAVKNFRPSIVKQAGRSQRIKPSHATKQMRSGATKKQKASQRAAENRQLAKDIAVKIEHLQDLIEVSHEQQEATQVAVDKPDLHSPEVSPEVLAEKKRLKQVSDCMVVQALNFQSLLTRIQQTQREMEHTEQLSQTAHRSLQKKMKFLLNRVKSAPAPKKGGPVPATELQTEHTIEQPASAPVPASQDPGSAAQGPSPAAPLSGPTTQDPAAAAQGQVLKSVPAPKKGGPVPATELQTEHTIEQPASAPVPASQDPGSAAQGPSPAAPLSGPTTQDPAAAAQGQVSTEPLPNRIDYNEAFCERLGTINGQMAPGAIEDAGWEKHLDEQSVFAGMLELEARLCVDRPDFFMLSPARCAAYADSKPTDVHAADFFSRRESSLFIVGVFWLRIRDHYAMFRAERKQLGHPWSTQWWDPFVSEPASSKKACQSLVRNLDLLPPAAKLKALKSGTETHSWKSGLQVLAKMEVWIREWRGEPPRVDVAIQEVHARLNEFLSHLRSTKKPGAQSSGPAAGSSCPATEGSGAAAEASGPAKAAPVQHESFEKASSSEVPPLHPEAKPTADFAPRRIKQLADGACVLDLLPPVRDMELRPSTWFWRDFRFTVVFDKGGNPNGWEAACIMNHEDGGHCRKRLVHKSGAAPDVIDLVQRSLKFWCLQCGHATRVAHRDTPIPFPDEIPDEAALEVTPLVVGDGCNRRARLDNNKAL